MSITAYRLYVLDEDGRAEVLSIDGAQFFPDRAPIVDVTLYIGHGAVQETCVPAEHLHAEDLDPDGQPSDYQRAADLKGAVLAEMRGAAA